MASFRRLVPSHISTDWAVCRSAVTGRMVQMVQTEVTKKQHDEIAALSVSKERTSTGCISKVRFSTSTPVHAPSRGHSAARGASFDSPVQGRERRSCRSRSQRMCDTNWAPFDLVTLRRCSLGLMVLVCTLDPGRELKRGQICQTRRSPALGPLVATY
jgi:hypothetical protein